MGGPLIRRVLGHPRRVRTVLPRGGPRVADVVMADRHGRRARGRRCRAPPMVLHACRPRWPYVCRPGPVTAARRDAARRLGPLHGGLCRTTVSEGDRVIRWRASGATSGSPTRWNRQVQALSDRIDEAAAFDDGDHRAVVYTPTPKGVAAAELDTGQREVLRLLLDTYFGRVQAGASRRRQPQGLRRQSHLEVRRYPTGAHHAVPPPTTRRRCHRHVH